ncbi:MAG: CoA transferase subunit A [Actinomycetota bacterium]|jgi:glutaconate CoA-transferase subunit A|nr:CoA transferase subunit A [Actinomycetota bacterium]
MSKLLSLSDAVERYVPDHVGMLAVGGMHLHNNPMALVREIVRQQRTIGRLLTSPCGALNADLLIGAGLVDEIATSYVGFEHLGLAPCFRRAVEAGSIRVLECDEAYITHGLYAGAGGLAFIPLPAGLEVSDIPKVNQVSYATTTDPFTGREVLVGAPLCPDVALLHAYQADERGNAVLAGAHFVDRLMALASRTVLLQVEQVVPTEEIARHPVGTTIPGFLVQAVVEVAGGCHPTASHGAYDYDEQQLGLYLSMARSAEGVGEYLERHVTGVTEEEYLEKASPRLAELRYGEGPSPVPSSGRSG